MDKVKIKREYRNVLRQYRENIEFLKKTDNLIFHTKENLNNAIEYIKYKKGEITELEPKEGQLFIGPTVKKSSSDSSSSSGVFGIPVAMGYGPALGYSPAPRGFFGNLWSLMTGDSKETTQPAPTTKPINPQEIVNMFK